MSDFIYSSQVVNVGELKKEIKKIYLDNEPVTYEFHGQWGSLAISENLYNGFNPYENDEYIFIVIGGPVLYFSNNNFLNEKKSNVGTKAIFKRWLQGKIKWDEDLSGPFSVLIVNKTNSDVEFITDLMSFVPIYKFENNTKTIISTHIDIIANVSGQINNVDVISNADFILHGVVTYPYTIYQDIFQVEPATKHRFIQKSMEIKSSAYWKPKENYKYSTIREASDDLIKGIEKYINLVATKAINISQFISGGEDSRVLSALLKKHPRDAFIFLDQMNREGRMAQKAASAYGANLNIVIRKKTHYLDILPASSSLVGSGSQFHHAHSYGFHSSENFNKYSAVFGGLLADALLKGSHIKKRELNNYLKLGLQIKDKKHTVGSFVNSEIFTKEVLNEVTNRRVKHLKYIKLFRNDSAEEWFDLWPSSMNMNIPNIHANRRLFRSYEPFTSNDIVKLSASVPQKWKLNRRLFHKAVKPLLKPTKYLFHTEGRFPYFPWYTNLFIQFIYQVYIILGNKIGFTKGYQGPWTEWSKIFHLQEWDELIFSYNKNFKKIELAFNQKDVKELLNNKDMHFMQKLNLMQVLYLLNEDTH